MKELFILNKNNQKLKTFIYDDINSGAVIIMCHGFSGSSSGVMFPQIAKALSEKYLVCRFDFNGQGESDGNFYDSSIKNEIEDLEVIVDYIKQNYNIDKVVLLGHSFGTVIMMLYAENKEVDGLISLSGEGDLEKAINYEFSDKQLEDFEVKGEAFYENWSNKGEMELLGKQFLDDMKKYSTINATKNIFCPVLFIHGTNDNVIPDVASKEMFELVKEKSDLILLKNVDHMYDIFLDNPKVEDVINYVKVWIGKFN